MNNDISFFNKMTESGYSLKKKELKIWIYTNGLTQGYIARKLGIDIIEFKERLKNKELFEPKYIERLVYLLKAENAFKVIYFPTNKMRKEVYEKVFNKELKEEGRWKRTKWET